jgi:hypothetical protein
MRYVSGVLWVATGVVFSVLPKLCSLRLQPNVATNRTSRPLGSSAFSEDPSLNDAKDSHDMMWGKQGETVLSRCTNTRNK